MIPLYNIKYIKYASLSVKICDSTHDVSQYGNVIYTEQIESRNK